MIRAAVCGLRHCPGMAGSLLWGSCDPCWSSPRKWGKGLRWREGRHERLRAKNEKDGSCWGNIGTERLSARRHKCQNRTVTNPGHVLKWLKC